MRIQQQWMVIHISSKVILLQRSYHKKINNNNWKIVLYLYLPFVWYIGYI